MDDCGCFSFPSRRSCLHIFRSKLLSEPSQESQEMMEYKRYLAGPIDFDPKENTLSGTVSGLRDVIHFEGTTAKELARAFRESIDS